MSNSHTAAEPTARDWRIGQATLEPYVGQVVRLEWHEEETVRVVAAASRTQIVNRKVAGRLERVDQWVAVVGGVRVPLETTWLLLSHRRDCQGPNTMPEDHECVNCAGVPW
jgi:putative ribosome biogenesis GTPase RsgA